MTTAFPKDPCFDAMIADPKTPPARWGTFGAHDPSLLEADGQYYVFSTGTFGENAYQIRTSADLIHWQYVGQAFPRGLEALEDVTRPVFERLGRKGNNRTLWAPDVVRGQDGKYWLYGCYSAVFGDNYSAIFLARSDTPDGEYRLDQELVLTGGDWGATPNAIDPQVFYTPRGEMYMTYGSFFGGIRILELDPRTGRRKDGYTWEMVRKGRIRPEDYYGRTVVRSSNIEGSVVALRRGVSVCAGDVFADQTGERRADFYYLMGSADSLARDYNMRVWRSESPAAGYNAPPYGEEGARVSGSFSWRRWAEDPRIGFDFFAPGHNDLVHTKSGVDLLVYHCRTPFIGKKPRPHYLFLSMAAFNSKGDLVMSPNRYAGESVRRVLREELSGKTFDYVRLPRDSRQCAYASAGLRLEEDGTLRVCGARRGEWKRYGENFVCFTFDGERYYGAAMPAWIEAEGRGGITISARGEGGLPFFLNQSFA